MLCLEYQGSRGLSVISLLTDLVSDMRICNYHPPLQTSYKVWMKSHRRTLKALPMLIFDQRPVLCDLFLHLAFMVTEGQQWSAQPDILYEYSTQQTNKQNLSPTPPPTLTSLYIHLNVLKTSQKEVTKE